MTPSHFTVAHSIPWLLLNLKGNERTTEAEQSKLEGSNFFKLEMSHLQQLNHKGWQLIYVVSMAFVMNDIKWLLWTVETMY